MKKGSNERQKTVEDESFGKCLPTRGLRFIDVSFSLPLSRSLGCSNGWSRCLTRQHLFITPAFKEEHFTRAATHPEPLRSPQEVEVTVKHEAVDRRRHSCVPQLSQVCSVLTHAHRHTHAHTSWKNHALCLSTFFFILFYCFFYFTAYFTLSLSQTIQNVCALSLYQCSLCLSRWLMAMDYSLVTPKLLNWPHSNITLNFEWIECVFICVKRYMWKL